MLDIVIVRISNASRLDIYECSSHGLDPGRVQVQPKLLFYRQSNEDDVLCSKQ
jgi:hypothetical protein